MERVWEVAERTGGRDLLGELRIREWLFNNRRGNLRSLCSSRMESMTFFARVDGTVYERCQEGSNLNILVGYYDTGIMDSESVMAIGFI